MDALPKPGETISGYRYYKFPEPESYNLNRLLYVLRMSADERQRFQLGMDAMIAEYQLRPDEIAAPRPLF